MFILQDLILLKWLYFCLKYLGLEIRTMNIEDKLFTDLEKFFTADDFSFVNFFVVAISEYIEHYGLFL